MHQMQFPNPAERKDRIIRYTDFDALSSRCSCVLKHYLSDSHAHNFVNGIQTCLPRFNRANGASLSTKRVLSLKFSTSALLSKYPVINRGTYLRTVTIDNIIDKFLKTFHQNTATTTTSDAPTCQIVSLGAGSDTRVFKLLPQHPRLKYVEIDFPESTKLKSAVIANDPELSSLLLPSDLSTNLQQKFEADVHNYPTDIHTPNYHLTALDLRQTSNLESFLTQNEYLDAGLPTLVLSECVLCYIEPQLTNEILAQFTKHLAKGAIVVYEPMSLNDNFGNVMIENLKSRGISIPTLKAFPTVEAQAQRLQMVLQQQPQQSSNGSTTLQQRVFVNDMDFTYNHWISEDEKVRVSKLELLDELEEWSLLSRHYSLSLAVWDGYQQQNDQMFEEFIRMVGQNEWQITS